MGHLRTVETDPVIYGSVAQIPDETGDLATYALPESADVRYADVAGSGFSVSQGGEAETDYIYTASFSSVLVKVDVSQFNNSISPSRTYLDVYPYYPLSSTVAREGAFSYVLAKNVFDDSVYLIRIESDFETYDVLEVDAYLSDIYWDLKIAGHFAYACPKFSQSGRLFKIDLGDFATVVVLDLSVVDPDYVNFAGACTDDSSLFLAPEVPGGTAVKIDLSNFTTAGVSSFDTSTVDDQIGGAFPFVDADEVYFPSAYGGVNVLRLAKSDFTTSRLIDTTTVDPDLRWWTGGIWDGGRYIYLLPWDNGGLFVRFDIQDAYRCEFVNWRDIGGEFGMSRTVHAARDGDPGVEKYLYFFGTGNASVAPIARIPMWHAPPYASAALAGAGALRATTRAVDGSALLSGTGTFRATTHAVDGHARLAGLATVRATTNAVDGHARLAGVGSIAANINITRSIASLIQGTGTVAASATLVTATNEAAISGAGTVAASTALVTLNEAAISSTGTLAVDIYEIPYRAYSAMSGQATVVASATLITAGESAIAGAATVAGRALDDIFWDSVKLLMGYEGTDGSTTMPDEGPLARGNATVAGNAQIDTSVFKFGTSALQCDGTGDSISYADSDDWDFGANDFTVEFWIRFSTGLGTEEAFIGQWGGTTAWFFYLTGGILQFRFTDTGAVNRDTNVAWTPTVDTWYHMAVDRDGADKFRIYRDGVMVASNTHTQTIRNGSLALTIGTLSGFPSYDLTGRIDELRITKGVARYASDGGFTPPAAAYPRG